ncbi:LOW QUALITY PROTEIN: hypothetical protein HJC23_010331, partial [Cyclotella cryptica]
GKSGRPPRSFKVGTNQTARRGLESQCLHIKILCYRNRVSRLYPNLNGHKATTKQSASDTRNFTAKTSQRPTFLGMVQYYRDLWARCSKMLAPLTSLVGECGHTKVTKAKKTKKRPWYWDEVHQIAFDNINLMFANRSDEDVIYPLTVKEIAQAQATDAALKRLSLHDKYSTQLVEDTELLCKNGKMVIPKALQSRATLNAAMYWKGMRNTVRSHVKNCRTCQVTKRRKHKYGKLPTKLAITNPWEALCVDLIGPYTLKGKDGTEIDFMCLTMIDQASSWFEVVELPVTTDAITPMDNKGQKGIKTHDTPKLPYFDKSSAMITIIHVVNISFMTMEANSNFTSKPYVNHMGSSPTSAKNPQANAIPERVHQVIMTMLRTTELNMAATVVASDIDVFLTNAECAIRSTYHTVLKASPGAAIFGRDMLFDVPFLADWTKIGEHRQHQTDLNTKRENCSRHDWDYKVGDQILLRKDGILLKIRESI